MKLPTRMLFLILLWASPLVGVQAVSAGQTSPPTQPPPPSETQHAKPISPNTPPPPPPPETRADMPIDPSTPPPPPPDDTAAKPEAESAEPAFDPYHAQRSLNVGTFYLKTGKYDAAIDRFQEAAR